MEMPGTVFWLLSPRLPDENRLGQDTGSRQSKDEVTWYFENRLFTTFRQNLEVDLEADVIPAFFSLFVNSLKLERGNLI